MTKKELNISNIWGQIPIGNIVQKDCYKCIFAQIAILSITDPEESPMPFSYGIRFCLELLQKKHKGANLAHLLVILKSCGADKDPWGVKEWKNYAETFKKLETAFENELPSLIGADLSGAELRWAILIGVDFSKADFSKADLGGASFSNTNFSNANLIGANLIGVDLSEASLRRANLSEASLRRANLRNTNLSGADLRGVDLSEANFEKAKYNAQTILPAGFDPEEEEMIKL